MLSELRNFASAHEASGVKRNPKEAPCTTVKGGGMKDKGGGGGSYLCLGINTGLTGLSQHFLVIADTAISEVSFQVPEKQNF